MPRPVPIYTLADLETAVNVLPNGKPRKDAIRLRDCPLKEIVQWKCNVYVPESKKKSEAEIICEPLVRLFRQCENGLSVETTAWEQWKEKRESGGKCLR